MNALSALSSIGRSHSAWIAVALLALLSSHRAQAQCHDGSCSTRGTSMMQRGGNCADGSCSAQTALPANLQMAAAQSRRPDYNALRKFIPNKQIASHPRLFIYDDASMPRIYQMPRDHAGHQGFHYVSYNISADNSEPFGNPNIEFPWGEPGGTHRCPKGNLPGGVVTFKWLLLPEGKPVVWWERYDRSLSPVAWQYPEGTLVGEVLLLRCKDGQLRTFEMRTRERLARSWTVDIFRPFPTSEHLAQALKSLDTTEQYASATSLLHHVSRPVQLTSHRLYDRHPRPAFDTTAQIDKLPDIDAKLQAALLENFEFTSALGETFSGDSCFAGTGGVFPENYDASHLGTTDASCNRCHRDVGKHVDLFQPMRDWYGYVRGSDEVFSMSWVDPSCVSNNGFPNQVRMINRPGIIERFDAARHVGYHPVEKQ